MEQVTLDSLKFHFLLYITIIHCYEVIIKTHLPCKVLFKKLLGRWQSRKHLESMSLEWTPEFYWQDLSWVYFGTLESIESLKVPEKGLSGKSQLMLVRFALSTIGAAHLPPPALCQAAMHVYLKQFARGLCELGEEKGPCPANTGDLCADFCFWSLITTSNQEVQEVGSYHAIVASPSSSKVISLRFKRLAHFFSTCSFLLLFFFLRKRCSRH